MNRIEQAVEAFNKRMNEIYQETGEENNDYRQEIIVCAIDLYRITREEK